MVSYANADTVTKASRFSLVVASLHHPTYGFDPAHSSTDIQNRWLCIHKAADASPKQFSLTRRIATLMRKNVVTVAPLSGFSNVMDKHCMPQIGETSVMAKGGEMVVVLKTVWIRLIQREWKKADARRNDVLRRRARPISIHEREITGMWPSDCAALPGVRGLMRAYSK